MQVASERMRAVRRGDCILVTVVGCACQEVYENETSRAMSDWM